MIRARPDQPQRLFAAIREVDRVRHDSTIEVNIGLGINRNAGKGSG